MKIQGHYGAPTRYNVRDYLNDLHSIYSMLKEMRVPPTPEEEAHLLEMEREYHLALAEQGIPYAGDEPDFEGELSALRKAWMWTTERCFPLFVLDDIIFRLTGGYERELEG